MNKKYLVVTGDSFTKGHWMGDKGSWAYYTAKKLNLELINLSGNGMSNEWASAELLSFLYRHEPIMNQIVVMVGWTDFARQLNFYSGDTPEHLSIRTIVPADLYEEDEQGQPLPEIVQNKHILKHWLANEYVSIYRSYFSMLHLKMLLQRYNTPYLFFDAVADNRIYYSNGESYLLSYMGDKIKMNFNQIHENFFNHFSDPTFSNKIFDKNYINFEGKSIFGWLSQDKNMKYSEGNDGHTNEEGANIISDMIIKEYGKLYN